MQGFPEHIIAEARRLAWKNAPTKKKSEDII